MNVLNAAIYSALSSNAALITALGGTAIYHLQAPEAKPLPYVVYSWQGGGGVNDSPHDDNESLRFVRAYAATAQQAGAIDALIKPLLHKVALAVTGYTTVFCFREDDYETVETLTSGVNTYAMGGLYRIRLTK
ncbi:MAG: tail completion protein gp17 [Bellilinea sp.]